MEFNGARNDIFIVDVNGRQKSPFHPRINDIRRFRLKKSEKDLLEITQPITFKALNHEEKMEKIRLLGDWLIHKDWKTLSFDDEPGRCYLVILNGMDDFSRENNSFLWKGSLSFTAKATLGEEKTLSVSTTSQQHQITGQESTPWSIEVNFTENTNRYEFWAGDIYLQLNYEFIEGDHLTINYTGREVWLRDMDLRTSVSMSSNFEELKPGTTSFRASHNCTVKYTERYY